ncbi:MAG: bifunctional diaminohydroxyphosphoribosylaminopyrimidine deaminase/5-amino-6-(5-phosphoribosylamino)uracil reductase RibD [Verrucomicrobia bacterium]|nr:bifunctional diaminohydroxyphosphoribosylaminopyrimidine deaminase/5-amino-6-(5-phosphoribosylamino)uracil reductase RibD [Verrucomicrobiota bacterium]
MARALALARRGWGRTSPNPMVGAVLVRNGRVIGEGWHRRAGMPHAEIEALRAAKKAGYSTRGADLYVTLEPCCTHGRTPPCVDAITAAGIRRVIAASRDINPVHAGKGFRLLQKAGVETSVGLMSADADRLNEFFRHWIVHRQPFVTVKSAMTLDGKIATARGESKWITGPEARAHAMRLRRSADAMLVGVSTVLADDPSLTVRTRAGTPAARQPARVVLDSRARTPLNAKVVTDAHADRTLIVVTSRAPQTRIRRLSERVRVWTAPEDAEKQVSIPWVLSRLGEESITHVLVEGGGEVAASFLLGGHASRFWGYYAPRILGGRAAIKASGGKGAASLREALRLTDLEYQRVGTDLWVTARIESD